MLLSLVPILVAVNAVQAQPNIFNIEKAAGVNDPEVPKDRFLRSEFYFNAPSLEEVARCFEVNHLLSEISYKGNGYWDVTGEYRSEVRNTSNRVLGYLAGHKALGIDIYKQRALEGLEYLLQVQSNDGDFPWYHNSYRGIYNRGDGLFEAGIAGRAFIEGYNLTKDKRFLDASHKVARWEMDCPVSPNNNYNMFAVWHLTEHYRVTQDALALESAIEKTKLGGIPGQMLSGGWPGHNSWLWYHGIIVRGLVDLYSVLPDTHPFKPELKASLIAAINRGIRDQLSSGQMPPNPGVEREFHTSQFMLQALIMARRLFGSELDNCIHGLMKFRISCQPDETYMRDYAKAWKDHNAGRIAARNKATNAVVWRADMANFCNDPDWGEMAGGAYNCWYPCNDFVPGRQVWQKTISERTVSNAQEIISKGIKLFGGMGWTIPKGMLTPGRCYGFTASVRCKGTPETMPLILASAYIGENRPVWDPASGCKMTRENPTFDSYSEVSVIFTASSEMNNVYIWTIGHDIAENDAVSIIVDEAFITDAGDPLPEWNSNLRQYDQHPDMILLPVGLYLETMFQKTIWE